MSGERAFRYITPEELRWFPWLDTWPAGEPNDDLVDLFWVDVDLDDGRQVGIGLYRRRPYNQGAPAVTVNLSTPGERTRELHKVYRTDEFTPAEYGGRWGRQAELTLRVSAEGNPIGFDLRVEFDDFSLDVTGDVVCPGLKFSTASPGFSGYREESRLAVGWWPVTPRATARAILTWRGERHDQPALVHIERQLATLPLAGDEAADSAQSIWSWGHFNAGEYTAIWTDSAASAAFGYNHFSPFVLYRGPQPILSTFNFTAQVEKFVVDPDSGLTRPDVTTIRAGNGEVDFFARLVNGRVSDQFELNDRPGSLYCRQVSTVEGRVDHWGCAHRLRGQAVHEWGSQAGNYPFRQAERT